MPFCTLFLFFPTRMEWDCFHYILEGEYGTLGMGGGGGVLGDLFPELCSIQFSVPKYSLFLVIPYPIIFKSVSICIDFHVLLVYDTVSKILFCLFVYFCFSPVGQTSYTAALFPESLWHFLILHLMASDSLTVTRGPLSSLCSDSFAMLVFLKMFPQYALYAALPWRLFTLYGTP